MFDQGQANGIYSLLNASIDDRADQIAGLDGASREALVLELESLRRRLYATQAQVLASMESDETTTIRHGLTTANWLARTAHVPAASARRRVKTSARLCREFGEVLAALDSGMVGFDHATTLSDAANPRVAADFAAVQSELLDLVPITKTFDLWAYHVRRLGELFDQDGAHRESPDRVSSLKMAAIGDDTLRVVATFFNHDAVVVRQIIDRQADRLFRQHVADSVETGDVAMPTRDQLAAAALVELAQLGQRTHHCNSGAHHHADITVVIDASDETPIAVDQSGISLTAAETAAICCDATFFGVTIDANGTPLSHGRAQRLATPAQRRALLVRDGGCVFPGCDASVDWCDAHHVIEFENGGPTDLDNLALLCRRHHGITHRTDWQMQHNDPPPDVGDTDDPPEWSRFVWTTPTGAIIYSQHKHAILKRRDIHRRVHQIHNRVHSTDPYNESFWTSRVCAKQPSDQQTARPSWTAEDH